MVDKNLKKFLCLAGVLFLGGCASNMNYFSLGQQHLQREEHEEAIRAFESARKERPDDPKIKRELGIGYYQKSQFDKAIPLLLEAFLADTSDGRTLFYLGTAFEATNDIPHALDIYRRYVDVSRAKHIRKSIEARLIGLIRKQMAEEAKSVLAGESAIDAASIPDSTVAVLYFKNMGRKHDLDPIQKGLTDMLITDLSKTRKLKVVERVRMQQMLDEMGLGKTGLVDVSTAPRVGKLLGASKLVNGTFMDLTDEALRIDAGFVLTKNDKPLAPSNVQGKLAQLFRMEKDLAFGILDRFKVPLTRAERDEINTIPTENLLAFIAYCNGLDYEDKGMYREAGQQYQRAVDLDPHFSSAAQGVARAENLVLFQMPVSALEELYAQTSVTDETTARTSSRTQEQSVSSTSIPQETPSISETGALQPPAGAVAPLVDQMLHTAGVLDQGFLPGIDSRKPTQDENQSSFGNAASFKIRVHLPQE